MAIFSIIFCFLMIIISFFSNKRKINPVSVFYSLWFVIITLSYIRLFSLRETSNRIYGIIFLGLLFFAIGYYLIYIFSFKYSFKIKKKSDFKILVNVKEYIPRYKLLYILGIIIILFYFLDFSKIFIYILKGSDLKYIRELAQDSNSILNANRSLIENVIKNLIVAPGAMAFQPIVAIDFWKGKRDKKLIIINFLIILLRVITDGSRIVIVYFLIHMIVAFGFTKNNINKVSVIKKKQKKEKIFIIMFFIIGIFVLYKATLSRSGENIIRFFYYYFSMEPYMFEIWSNKVDDLNIIGYGIAATNGFSFLLFYILKNGLRFSSYPVFWETIYNLIQATDSKWKIIAGEGITANAYVSLFWFFYLDGRIIGVIIGMFIYGFGTAVAFVKALKKDTTKHICIYSFILQGLFFSFIRFQFANLTYVVAFLIIMFFAYKPIYKPLKE